MTHTTSTISTAYDGLLQKDRQATCLDIIDVCAPSGRLKATSGCVALRCSRTAYADWRAQS